MNEPHTANLTNITVAMWTEISATINELNQTFVNTVRETGGNNYNRHLMVTPYFGNVGTNTSDSYGRIKGFVDKENKKLHVDDPRTSDGKDTRLIASLHTYEPWGFTVAPVSSSFYSSTYPDRTGNVDSMIRIIRENFVDLGIPVIMGETGAIYRTNGSSNNNAERIKWAEHFVGTIRSMGVPVIIWDNGRINHASDDHSLFDRRNIRWLHPEFVSAFVNASSIR